MQGVITRVQVLAHPVVVVESFGLKVLWRALLAGGRETFLDIVNRSAEEEAHAADEELPLARTVKRFAEFERRVRDLYRRLAVQLLDDEEAARFFRTLSAHEEGHAIVLCRVRRELRRGRLWKESKDLHLADVQAFDAVLSACEAEVRRGVPLARALAIAERLEASELNVVFETLNGCVDMRSRARFERFFVLTQRHLAFFREGLAALRARDGVAAAAAETA
jgi:rubrerythrin